MVQDCVEYRLVAEYPAYRVGDDGSIWSCWKRVSMESGSGCQLIMSKEWRKLKGTIDKYGYVKVILCNLAKRRHVRVHTLVLEAFVGQCPYGMEAAHENAVKTDNRRSNLRWATPVSNAADTEKHGRQIRGLTHPLSKATPIIVKEIRRRRLTGDTVEAISVDTGLSMTQISRIARRESWKHIA